jgi:DNA-binding response OmpR family regulator
MPDQQRSRVLIVEDDAQIAAVLGETLHDEGFDIRRAGDGREGLAILSQWTPDAIILDLMMPIMDGPTFRAAQRLLPAPCGTVPVIILSGARNARAQAEAMAATAVITKPFDLDDVIDRVRAICQPD